MKLQYWLPWLPLVFISDSVLAINLLAASVSPPDIEMTDISSSEASMTETDSNSLTTKTGQYNGHLREQKLVTTDTYVSASLNSQSGIDSMTKMPDLTSINTLNTESSSQNIHTYSEQKGDNQVTLSHRDPSTDSPSSDQSDLVTLVDDLLNDVTENSNETKLNTTYDDEVTEPIHNVNTSILYPTDNQNIASNKTQNNTSPITTHTAQDGQYSKLTVTSKTNNASTITESVTSLFTQTRRTRISSSASPDTAVIKRRLLILGDHVLAVLTASLLIIMAVCLFIVIVWRKRSYYHRPSYIFHLQDFTNRMMS